jgi:hypothetical protein
MQALSGEQSELMTHSGRQLGGEPIMVGRQEHWHCSPTTRGGLVLGPQGFGWQGSIATTGSMARRTEELPIAQLEYFMLGGGEGGGTQELIQQPRKI